MARDLHGIISGIREGSFEPPFQREGSDDAFLQIVIQPIYSVMQKVFSHMFLLNVFFCTANSNSLVCMSTSASGESTLCRSLLPVRVLRFYSIKITQILEKKNNTKCFGSL